MSVIRTWTLLLLGFSLTTQDKTPDVHVTCVFSEDCTLPCSFQPADDDDDDPVVRWFRQSTLVFSSQKGNSEEEKEEDEVDSSEEEQYAGRIMFSPQLASQGNATLILKECGPKDRGRYSCRVHTSENVHESHVIVKVEAPVQSLTLKLTRLSGYEEMKCTTQNVYPAPHVVWATDPPNSEVLRPITRKLPGRQGLYTVESRLRRMKARPELLYICKVTSAYGTQTWTASLREREISGQGGKDLTIPCHAPPYLHDPSLSWSFASGNDPTLVITYDSLSQHSFASPVWKAHVLLDTTRVSTGDGSLQLLDADHMKHTGVYTCVCSTQHNTHTEHTEVVISAAVERLHSWEPSYWWIVALVIMLLIVVLVGMLVYLKVKGNHSKARKCPEEATEPQSVKDKREEIYLTEISPLAEENTNG